jgi:hypothetical protein
MFILLNLERVTNGVATRNIYKVMLNTLLNTLLTQVGLTKVKIENKLVYIRINNGSMFAGCRTSVSMQLKEKLAPLLVAIHSCAHHTNLAIQVLFIMAIMQHLEDLL